jgi:hypothetical protein
MTLAAWEVFDRPKGSIYYVRIKDDAIDWIRPKSASLYTVRDRLRIGEYLMSLGVAIRPDGLIRSKVPDVRYKLAKELLNNPNSRKQMQGFAERLADQNFTKRNRRKGGLAFRLIEAGLLTDDSRSVDEIKIDLLVAKDMRQFSKKIDRLAARQSITVCHLMSGGAFETTGCGQK